MSSLLGRSPSLAIRRSVAALGLVLVLFFPLSARAKDFDKIYDLNDRASDGSGDGNFPLGGLVRGPDGYFYGTTNWGPDGTDALGTIFRIRTVGTAVEFEIVHRFSRPSIAGGANPSSLMRASDGNLYGTTESGGLYDFGTVFKLEFDLQPPQFETLPTVRVLHSFNCSAPGGFGGEGGDPFGVLVEGPGGALYGTTGGSPGVTVPVSCGTGTVFKINKDSSGFSVLSRFDAATNGRYTWGPVAVASDGSVWGALYDGDTGGNGTIFRVPAEGRATPEVMHVFQGGTDGANPASGLWRSSFDGWMYGLTAAGGNLDGGTIFRISRISEEVVFEPLYVFDTTLIWAPYFWPGLYISGDGKMYGSLSASNPASTAVGSSQGGIFEFDPVSRQVRVVYAFQDAGSNGIFPDGISTSGTFTVGTDRHLYGTNSAGGLNGHGTVFGLPSVTIVTHEPQGVATYTPNPAEADGPDGKLINLSAAGSTDEDWDYPLEFEWTLPGGVIATGMEVRHPFPVNRPGNPYSTVTLKVTDTTGKFSASTIHVVVSDNEAPTVTLTDQNGHYLPIAPAPGGEMLPSVVVSTSTGTADVNFDDVIKFVARDNVTDPGYSGLMTPLCTPASKTLFSLGSTVVICDFQDESGNHTTVKFLVAVLSGLPTITVPDSMTVEAQTPAGAPVPFTVIAMKADGGAAAFTCVPPSGSTFPIVVGGTLVRCIATDGVLPPVAGEFTVTVVDTTAPVIDAPSGTINVPGALAGGAEVLFDPVPSATDLGLPVPVTCIDITQGRTPRTVTSGSIFYFGFSTVECTATDTAAEPNTSVVTFRVQVNDDIAPEIHQGQSPNVSINGGDVVLKPVTLTVTARDNYSQIRVYCWDNTDQAFDYQSPIPENIRTYGTGPAASALGDGWTVWTFSTMQFPIGTRQIGCRATEVADIYYPVDDNSSVLMFTVTVLDKVAPALTLPANIRQPVGPGGTGAIVNFTATAQDIITVNPLVVCDPLAGSFFPNGPATTVTCRATDAAGNVATGTFTVTITVGPVITVPGNITVDATSLSGASVSFVASALTAAVMVTCTWGAPVHSLLFPAGSGPESATFPIGTTLVTCSASDGAVTSTKTFSIVVTDQPPVVTVPANITINASALGTATVSFFASARDAVDGARPVTCTWGTPVKSVTFTPPSLAPKSGTFPGGATNVVTTVTCTASDLPHAPNPAHAASATFTVTVTPTMGIGRFVAFSIEQTWLWSRTKVLTGDVGANTRVFFPSKGHGWDDENWNDGEGRHGVGAAEVRLGQSVVMAQAGSRVVGDTVWLQPRSVVYNVHDNDLIKQGNATVLGTVMTGLSLPLMNMPAFPATITTGSQNIVVNKNQTQTLSAGSYRTIQVKQNAVLVLTGGVYQMQSLDLEQGATILVTAATEVCVKGEFDAASKVTITNDPLLGALVTAKDIVFYVSGTDSDCVHGGSHADDDEEDHDGGPAIVHIGQRSLIKANIYAPGGTLWLKGNSNATGAFIGRRLRVGANTLLTLDSRF